MVAGLASTFNIMIKISLISSFLALQLCAGLSVYDGFSGDASREGWSSSWHRLQGTVGVHSGSVAFPGLPEKPGALLLEKKGEAIAQLGVGVKGNYYGGFRFRAAELKNDSLLALVIGSLPPEELTPKNAKLSFVAKGWRRDHGLLLLDGKDTKIENGIPIEANVPYQVLFQVEENRVQMWILNAPQVVHYAQKGFNAETLNAAPLGKSAGSVLQRIASTPKPGARLDLTREDFVACMAKYNPRTAFDEIRISTQSLADALGEWSEPVAVAPIQRKAAKRGAPNILFITMDDMNWDSMGAYGCEIPGLTPNMDQLAEEGLRFEYAYNATSSCVPSRTTYMTGRYPHTSGVLSFFNVDANYQMLPELLRENGYLTGCINKPRDSSVTDDYEKYWDYSQILKGPDKRGAVTYKQYVDTFLNKAEAAGMPFFCVVNIADPHKPFFNDPKGIKQGFDKFAPSRFYSAEEVPIPGFLFEHPAVRKEVRNYYNSVKRGDDCVGAILNLLEARGLSDDTVVIFLSDHGMPLPYAKSSLYRDGLRTPWVIRWPGKVGAGKVDQEHLVGAVDFMPTVLDIAKVEHPSGLQGKSVWPAILGKRVQGMDQVYGEFNDNAGGNCYPMRAIHTKRYNYVFNAWGTGQRSFLSAATWYQTEECMKAISPKNPEVAARYRHLLKRCPEEFYDLKKDPFALNNLIDDPAYQEIIAGFRDELEAWMIATDDYVLEAFRLRDDIEALEAWMVKADAAALWRAENLQWKRHANRAGGTGKNTLLYQFK